MVLNSKLFPSISSPIWLNKRFKLLIGIKDILTDEYIFLIGEFILFQILLWIFKFQKIQSTLEDMIRVVF